MITIFYNYACPEVIFPMAAFVVNLDKEYDNEVIDFIPIKAADLAKKLSEIQERLDEDIEILGDEKYFDDPDHVDLTPLKYALFGIHPKNKQETQAIASFFDENKERILIWLDWHPWPQNLLSFVNIPGKTFFNEIKTCLEVLSEEGYIIQTQWQKTEKAMLSHDLSDPLAARYWKAFLVSKSMGYNNFAKRGADFLLFLEIMNELIDNKESTIISDLENDFEAMELEVEEMVKQISDDHPLFRETKKMGRPVGCLFLEDVSEYFNVREMLKIGSQKYPWLCFISYAFNGQRYAYFESEKLTFRDIKRGKVLTVDDYSTQEELLLSIKEEIVKFKEVVQ